MKIDSYDVQTSAQRTQQSIQYSSQKFSMLEKSTTQAAPQNEGVQLDLTDPAKQMQEQAKDVIKEQAQKSKVDHPLMLTESTPIATDPDDLRIKLLESMLYALTGKRIKVSLPQPTQQSGQSQKLQQRMEQLAAAQQGAQQDGQSGRIGNYSLVTEHYQYESETVNYQAQGQIKTADGKSISVDIELNMSRAYSSYTRTSVELESKLVDPIVINYAGNAASLTEQKYSFDLDVDGKMDSISFAGQGSGFLALDKNGDGKINDGSELFGPSSGSGFEELRAHDQDKNGWIDENDDVFDKLIVWSKDAEGNDVYYKLKDLDIGAIYLGETQTEFSVKDGSNNTKGVVQSTSFFLKEDGGAGTVQHIDLAL